MSEDKGSLHQLTHRFFRFLEKEYDFSYDYGSNTFTSEIMSIHVSSDQLEPIVTVWFKSEPEFTRMNFNMRFFVAG